MQTDGGKRLRIGMVIPCHVGGSVHEHRDSNELLACKERHKEHVTIKKLNELLNTEEARGSYEEARKSAEKARENAENARWAAEKEATKAAEAQVYVEKAKAKAEEAKAKVEEERNKRIFELLKYSSSIGMNNVLMILCNGTGSMATMSDPQFCVNTLADNVPAVTSSDELVN